MIDTPFQLDEPASQAASASPLDRIRTARQVEQGAAVQELVAALDYAHDNLVLHRGDAAGWVLEDHEGASTKRDQLMAAHASGDVEEWFRDLAAERLVPLAGSGAPLVAEFAPAELAAHLDVGEHTATSLIADALELAHRLPRLWTLLVDPPARQPPVPVWRARLVTDHTRKLSLEQATWVDAQLALRARRPERLTSIAAANLTHQVLLRDDPGYDHRVAAEREARRGVWVSDPGRDLLPAGDPASTWVSMQLDTADARAFETTVGVVAHQLAGLGDARPLDVRRASAVGTLADPQAALELLGGCVTGARAAGATRGAGRVAGDAPAAAAPGRVAPRPRMALYLHLRADEAVTGAGVVVDERHGVLSLQTLTKWLTRFDLDLTPVVQRENRVVVHRPVDLDQPPPPVDAHDPTPAMRELLVLADETCVFPGCVRDSRGCDADHIDEYVAPDRGGPRGQTHNANLAPLCRRHHRVKTHTAWTYQRTSANEYAWTTPDGVPLISRTARRHC